MNRPVPRTPDEAAAYWVARRRLGLMSAPDVAEFEAWRSDPANEMALAQAQGVVDDVGAIAAFTEIRAMRQAALQKIAARRPAWATFGAMAASLAAIVLVATSVGEAPGPTAQDSAMAAAQRYVTGVGERRVVRLSDGSVVELNTASVVEVAYSEGRRDVRLLQGQALFDVAHNRERPFVVRAADRRVTALGTRFDVRVDGPAMKVVLVEGRVKVEPLRPVGLDRIAPVLARRTLEPGEAFAADPAEGVEVTVADTEQATSWRRGQVIFRDETIGEAIAEMNRYSDTQLVVNDPRIAGLRISGVFGVTRDENFLAALTSFYPIEAVQRSPRVTALRWREQNSQNR